MIRLDIVSVINLAGKNANFFTIAFKIDVHRFLTSTQLYCELRNNYSLKTLLLAT